MNRYIISCSLSARSGISSFQELLYSRSVAPFDLYDVPRDIRTLSFPFFIFSEESKGHVAAFAELDTPCSILS